MNARFLDVARRHFQRLEATNHADLSAACATMFGRNGRRSGRDGDILKLPRSAKALSNMRFHFRQLDGR